MRKEGNCIIGMTFATGAKSLSHSLDYPSTSLREGLFVHAMPRKSDHAYLKHRARCHHGEP